jgi:type IV pilus assembly protein PilA
MMKIRQKGFSLIELLIVVAIILIIAAIAIPNLLRSRMAANEASAVGSLRTVNTASVTYSTEYPATGYPASLAVLKPVAAGVGATSAAADLIDVVLSGGTKSGYSFTFTSDGKTPSLTYSNTAQPVTPGSSGQRYFFTNQSGVIRGNATAPATVADLPL